MLVQVSRQFRNVTILRFIRSIISSPLSLSILLISLVRLFFSKVPLFIRLIGLPSTSTKSCGFLKHNVECSALLEEGLNNQHVYMEKELAFPLLLSSPSVSVYSYIVCLIFWIYIFLGKSQSEPFKILIFNYLFIQ